MGFASFIRGLLPQENQYFRLFTSNIANVHEAATDLRKLLDAKTTSERKILIAKIEDAEHRGDQITHDIFADLSKTFVTPIDREDIHALASEIDDILDLMEDVAVRTSLYEVSEFPAEFRDLTDTLLQAVQDLVVAVPLLGDMKNVNVILQSCE